MPLQYWPIDPATLIQPFETRYGNPAAGGLFGWAASTVESLYYLDDIDADYDQSRETIHGHPRDVVDVAHARWAAGTCMTALDLCAAGLGHVFCGHDKPRELDLGHFAPNPEEKQRKQQNDQRRAQLPAAAQQWVHDVCADVRYKEIKDVHDYLTHLRLPRHLGMMPGGPHVRLKIGPKDNERSIRQLVQDAKNVGTEYVWALVEKLPEL